MPQKNDKTSIPVLNSKTMPRVNNILTGYSFFNGAIKAIKKKLIVLRP